MDRAWPQQPRLSWQYNLVRLCILALHHSHLLNCLSSATFHTSQQRHAPGGITPPLWRLEATPARRRGANCVPVSVFALKLGKVEQFYGLNSRSVCLCACSSLECALVLFNGRRKFGLNRVHCVQKFPLMQPVVPDSYRFLAIAVSMQVVTKRAQSDQSSTSKKIRAHGGHHRFSWACSESVSVPAGGG